MTNLINTKREKEPISEKELAKTLKQIVSKRVHIEPEGIEDKVQNRDLTEARIRVIEQSEVWKKHAKTHEGAKLQLLEVNKEDPQSIRESLGIDDVEYRVDQNVEFVSYNKESNTITTTYAAAPQNTTAGTHTYVSGHGDPNDKSWMGCTCGMTIKAEDNANGSGVNVSTYAIGNTTTNDSTYSASGTTDIYGTKNTEFAYE